MPKKIKFLDVYLNLDDEVIDVFAKIKSTKSKNLKVHIPERSMFMASKVNIQILKSKLKKLDKNIIFVSNNLKDVEYLKSIDMQADIKLTKKLKESSDLNVPKYIFHKPKRFSVITFFIASFVFLLLIVYLVLPSATILITPNLHLKTSSLNFIMIDEAHTRHILASEEDRVIQMQKITVEFEESLVANATGRIPRGENAKGRIKVVNSTANAWPIVKNSRLQTEDGLVFLTQNAINVPARGEIYVDVIARDEDAYGNPIGTRGNIEPTRFFFPGLSEYNQQLIWGESTETFEGATDVHIDFVTQADIDNALATLKLNLENLAILKLKEKAQNLSDEYHHYSFLDKTDRLIFVYIPEGSLFISANPNDQTKDFIVKGKIIASGYIYDEKTLEKKLVNNLVNKHLSPNEELLKVKDFSLALNEVLEVNAERGSIKINVSVVCIIYYDFSNEEDELVKNIKNTIVGMNKFEAESYINNLREVSKVHVYSWPLWTNNLPSMPQNIEIRIDR